MTTFHPQLTKALSEETIPPFWRGYFQENFRSMIHDQLLESFQTQKQKGFCKAAIAKKLGKRPEQITRWLAAPSNLNTDTISDLALALGYVPSFSLTKLEALPESQMVHPLVQRVSQGWNIDAVDKDYVTLKNRTGWAETKVTVTEHAG